MLDQIHSIDQTITKYGETGYDKSPTVVIEPPCRTRTLPDHFVSVLLLVRSCPSRAIGKSV